MVAKIVRNRMLVEVARLIGWDMQGYKLTTVVEGKQQLG